MKRTIRETINLKNILYFFIVLCPILDMTSFIFRNQFQTSFSPSTIIRPIIPIVVILYLFLKEKMKKKIIFVSMIYACYAIIHLYLFQLTKTGNAFGGLTHELQYLINYSFMILNLFIYLFVFNKEDTKALKTSVLIASAIYILSIYIAIITNTSSSTYIEGIGYKGWFETGNSISSILILSLFVIINLLKDKTYRYWVIGILILIGIYLTTLIGTRVGLFGFILVVFLYAMTEILNAILHRIQLNRKTVTISICVIILIVIGVSFVGSTTIQRRKYLKQIETNIIDETTNTQAHISGDMLKIKKQIDNHTLQEGYMSEAEKQSVYDLYHFANKHNIRNNDLRTQQLLYNMFLVKNQQNIGLVIFGNGYVSKFCEMVLEMEIPAFLLNFGIVGFLLYFSPFLMILLYGGYVFVKYRKQLDTEYIMLWFGLFTGFILACISGCTFFYASSSMLMICLSVILIQKIRQIKQLDLKQAKGDASLKKKILFGITSLNFGGAEKVLVELVKKLEKDYDITVFTLYAKGELEGQIPKSVKIKSLYQKSYQELSKCEKIVISLELLMAKHWIYHKKIKDHYDAEIAFLEGPITRLLSVANIKTRKIAWVHTDITKIFGEDLRSLMKKHYDRGIYESYDKVVFVSKDNQSKFKNQYPKIEESKLEVINNYVDEEDICKKAEQEEATELKQEDFNFVIVARLVKAKALDRFIQIHSKLIKEGLTYKAYIIGDGPEKEALSKKIEEEKIQDSCILLGKKENPYPYMKKAKVVALLSYYEGQPVTLIEAKALGKCIMITDTAAKELLVDYPNSIIVENTIQGIENGIKEVVKNKNNMKDLKETSYSGEEILDKIRKIIECNFKEV